MYLKVTGARTLHTVLAGLGGLGAEPGRALRAQFAFDLRKGLGPQPQKSSAQTFYQLSPQWIR